MVTKLDDAKLKVILNTEEAKAEIDKIKDEQDKINKARQKGDQEDNRQKKAGDRERQKVGSAARRFGIKLPSLSDVPIPIIAAMVTAASVAEIGLPIAAKVAAEGMEAVLDPLLKLLLQDEDSRKEIIDAVNKEIEAKVNVLSDSVSEVKAFMETVQPVLNQGFAFTKAQLLLGENPFPPGSAELWVDIFDFQRQRNRLRREVDKRSKIVMTENMIELFKNRFNN